jgi:DNA-binding NarL/FixJ family response regulator
MRPISAECESRIFSLADLLGVVDLVRTVTLDNPHVPFGGATTFQRVAVMLNADGGCCQRLRIGTGSQTRLAPLHEDNWTAADTRELTQVITQRLSSRPYARFSLPTVIHHRIHKGRDLHYLAWLGASASAKHLLLSFKRLSTTFTARETALLHAIHHALMPELADERALSLQFLSPRKREVLGELLTGKSEKEIGMQLSISPHTVHVHVKALYKRYGVSSRAELMSRSLAVRATHLTGVEHELNSKCEGPASIASRQPHYSLGDVMGEL